MAFFGGPFQVGRLRRPMAFFAGPFQARRLRAARRRFRCTLPGVSSSEARTRGVHVQSKSRFVPERSSPEHGTWFFAYTVLITNDGPATVQLLNRHWIITNADGHVEEVRGPGVVGAQPVLQPGES